MIVELEEYWEHAQRYRSVTLQMLRMLTDDELEWRPTPDAMSLGQQFVHIAQAEESQAEGLLNDDWDEERLRLPEGPLRTEMIRDRLLAARSRTERLLTPVTSTQLEREVGEPAATLRSWLWFLLEHEVHHKAQIALYLRLMGRTPPFFAAELADGARPDAEFRERLGGV